MGNVKQEISSLTIGRLAQAAGVNVETVRYYQRRGLIEKPEKPLTGFRKYGSSVIDQIRFIRKAQHLGFSLKEIAELLELGNGHCRDVRIRAETKRDAIEQQIHDLQILHDTLSQLICACREGKDRHHCPIVETLLEKDS